MAGLNREAGAMEDIANFFFLKLTLESIQQNIVNKTYDIGIIFRHDETKMLLLVYQLY